MLLSPKSVETLQKQKNLLAFSAGVDSTALFFLLLEQKISFDIVLVNYHTRESSSKEARYAKELAQTHHKKCYVKEVLLEASNFEHEARKVRYAFFETLIARHHYQNLITAHHLNDRLEWFLMQLSKGAGLVEMLGFDEIEQRETYQLIRPLIHTDKASLQAYLDTNKIKYFIDESNFDPKYKRNFFRTKFANPLLKQYKEGIKKSFTYLSEDKALLFELQIIERIEELVILKKESHDINNIRQIDKILKYKGYILSKSQKDEILKNQDVVIANTYVVILNEDKIYIAPYVTQTMDKKSKELYRKAHIPVKIRPYLCQIGYIPKSIQLNKDLPISVFDRSIL